MKINAINVNTLNRNYSTTPNTSNISFKSTQNDFKAYQDTTQFKAVKANESHSFLSKLIGGFKEFIKPSDKFNPYSGNLDEYVAERMYLI